MTDAEEKQAYICQCVSGIIETIGEDPRRPGLKETPMRVARACEEMFSGYKSDPSELFKVFPDEITRTDGLVIERNIAFYSTCEHHMLPFSGMAHFGYTPKDNRLIGASKISRLIDCFSRRLQVQEKLGQQIVDCFMEHMKPDGCMLVLVAKHNCMMCRGIKQADAEFITSHIAGSFEDYALRNEFLHLINLSNK